MWENLDYCDNIYECMLKHVKDQTEICVSVTTYLRGITVLSAKGLL